ncbi:hypothetical protein L490_3506 [Bordetella bronchiseptica 00-P-2796]|uniref:Uncharacterized protein n=1 Tax=Bordetella bronchiseptica 00-P-2796 TaxID=1331199 RepID=A0ABR4RIL7_BORBO|nr:hypothetical protein L490_3506 [Bordetella bronchiseptica 00-P-2796]
MQDPRRAFGALSFGRRRRPAPAGRACADAAYPGRPGH